MKKILYRLLYLIVLFNCFNAYSQETSKPAVTQRIIEPTDPGCDENEKYPWFYDNDGDGAGNPDSSQMACSQPNNKWVSNSDDCNDNNPAITYYTWYYDGDKDGFGASDITVTGCTQPTGYVDNNLDCNDNNKDIHPNTKWYIDTNGDGIVSELDTNYVISCTKPSGNYVAIGTDSNAHWIHNINFDVMGNIVGINRSYFDDLGKSDVSLSKDYVTNKIWGTETTYDNFGRTDKTSFIAPSPLNTFEKTNFLKSSSEAASSSYPPTLSLNNITSSNNYKASQTITVTGTVSPGLNVTLTAPTITLSSSNNFIITATPGSSFVVTAANLPDVSANPSLANYYSDNNIYEPYQATATHPFAQANYDSLNPGNIINVVGGNKINGEWKTGYTYTVPAAQEMYYIYGSDYYDGTISGGREEVITKFYKSVSVDANGNENVAFTDGEGKLLATARSGGPTTYPVVSLIGTQGFVDIHIPAGITSGISLIGGAGLYKIYDLKTGSLTSGITGGNAYRVEAITTPVTEPKTYISGGHPTYDAGSLGITYSVNYYDYAVNVYNKTGQLIKTIQPNGYTSNTTVVASPSHMTSTDFVSTYEYNSLGQLVKVSNPDEGISKFAYRNDGQIRFSQSALQAVNNEKASYTDYDEYGRPVESGVYSNINDRGSVVITNGIWSSLSQFTDSFNYYPFKRLEQTFIVYDVEPSTQLPADLNLNNLLTNSGTSPSNYIQKNLSGNVSMTYAKPGSTISSITWYSYDLYGRAEWIAQYTEGLGIKTIHYEYDYKGNVKKVLFQKDKTAELFVHQYTYNSNDVLIKVQTSTDNNNFITNADYSYYQTGELKRVNIAQGTQGIDYVYTLGGQLKSINHPSLEPSKDPGGDGNDVFGLTLDYYNGDYLRTGRNITSSPTTGSDYSGNIKAARWANKGVAGDYNGSTTNQKGYLYNYNRNNWLTGATFGNANSNNAVITPSSVLGEGGLTYDANGNIKTLQRTNEAGTVVDNLIYNYTNAGNNQLNNITENATATSDPSDVENQSAGNYIYDAIGQLKQNVSENLYYSYNTKGLVTEVKKGSNPIVKFFYNDRGQRIKKESYNTSTFALLSTTFYQLDLSGNTLAVYNLPSGGSVTQIELPIYGLDRLGIYKKTSRISSYEIKDHLGNVRAIVEKEGGIPVIKSFADYYPFGEQLPSRNALSNYRYAFQGQELDNETGMEAFQLRLWDGRIGRWLSPDPMGEFYSPYLGIGNNPIGAIDPDGGDIIYLNSSEAVHGLGHAAVLIGNDRDGWRYLSMNGTGEGAAPSGGSKNADLGDTPYRNGFGNDFRGTKLTATQVMKIVNNSNKKETHNYNRAIRIKTSTFEDRIAYEAAKKQASGANYNIFGSSCIDVPQEAIEAVVANRLNIQSRKTPHFWSSLSNTVNFFDAGKYGFKMLIPNQYFDNFGTFTKKINSDLQTNPLESYRVIVGPLEEKK